MGSGDGPAAERDDGNGRSRDRREKLNRHWYFVADQINRAGERRDRYVVFGAAGALVLSITFLQQVSPEPVGWSLWLLVASWASLLVAMGCSLLSWDTTYLANWELLESIGERIVGADRPSLPDDELDRRTRRLTVSSLISLFVGVLLLTLFAAANLPW